MKKIFLAAFIALCGVSFSFGESRITCQSACFEKFQSTQEQQNCLANECGFSEKDAAAAVLLSTQTKHEYEKGTLTIPIPDTSTSEEKK